MMEHIIAVNESGKSADGEDYDHVANPEMVKAGYMLNTPVLIQYPDGRLREGNKVQITSAGIEFLRRNMPVGDRTPAGNA